MLTQIGDKMNLPSKELLSEVLKIYDCKPYKIQDTDLWFEYEVDEDYRLVWTNDSINIYELAHKCKEWAWDNTRSFHKKYYGGIGYISSGITYQNKFYCEIGYGSGEDETFEVDSEPEAIFKACQWILDNKETK